MDQVFLLWVDSAAFNRGGKTTFSAAEATAHGLFASDKTLAQMAREQAEQAKAAAAKQAKRRKRRGEPAAPAQPAEAVLILPGESP